jgi:hypothetical protein
MADDWCNRPLELWRPGTTPDGQGGVTEALEQVGDEPLLAKVDQPTATDKGKGGTAIAQLAHSIYFDGVVDVRRGDELRDPGADPADPASGDVFRVQAVARPSEPVYTKALARLDQIEEG